MHVEKSLDTARELRRENRHEEALAICREVIATDPANADAWWITGLAQHSLGRIDESIEALRKMLRHAPRFAAGWAQYGVVLGEAGKLEDAKKAFWHALRIDPKDGFTRREAARVCEKAKDYDGQIQHLVALDELGQANSYDLNSLGTAHLQKEHFSRAIEYYSRSAALDPHPAPYFNLALVYSHRRVLQDLDAVDSLHRALRLKPDHARAKERLSELTGWLENQARNSSKTGQTLLDRDEWFQFYLNPFELLGASSEQDIEEFDHKTIQRLKRRLIQQVELEEGAVETLQGFILDRSRMIGLCDELYDDNLREYHWRVFRNPFLLRFLSRGDIRHFLYRPADYITTPHSPEERGYDIDTGIFGLLEEIDSESSEFKEWISEPFAKQYNLVLSRALDRGLTPVVWSLFAGRRWVLRRHEEICFSGAHRYVDRLLEPFRNLVKSAKTKKPSLTDVENLFNDKNALGILNVLPEPFRDQQFDAVRAIRDIAIASYNQHNDIDLSHAILALSKRFNFKSAELTQRLDDDFQQVQKLIAEERKHEVKLMQGKEPVEITKEGVRKGSTFIPANSISSIRWGIFVRGYEYAPTYEFLMICASDSERDFVSFHWQSSDKKDEATSLLFVEAALNYIVPNLLIKTQSLLQQGKQVRIGKCVLSQDAIAFDATGWLLTKRHSVPWQRLGTEVQNGTLTVYDQSSPRTRTAMSFFDCENAVVLQALIAQKKN
jgi:tetratricopeptide (TPR) repeat protein